MKASLTLNGSLSVMSQVLALLVDHGFDTDETNEVITIKPPLVVGNAAPDVITVTGQDTSTVAPTSDSAIVAAPEFDGTGLAWDARIHDAGKGQTTKGAWTKKRKVDAETYNAVEAELRARYPNPQSGIVANVPTVSGTVDAGLVTNETPVALPTVAPVLQQAPVPNAAPIPVLPVAAPVLQQAPVVSAPPVNAAPIPVLPVAAPVATPEPVAQVQGDPVDFNDLMTRLGPLFATTVDNDYLLAVLAEVNGAWAAHGVHLSSLMDVAAKPEVIPYIWQLMQRDGKVA